MSDNTERELRRVIDRARRADDYSLIGTDRIVGAILAEFMPEHDERVRREAATEQRAWREAAQVVLEHVRLNDRPALEMIEVAAAIREAGTNG